MEIDPAARDSAKRQPRATLRNDRRGRGTAPNRDPAAFEWQDPQRGSLRRPRALEDIAWTSDWQDRYYASADGLQALLPRLRARRGRPLPVLCLPGLTRNSRDFDQPRRFACGTRRRVLCADLRGRGRSQHDPNWQNYHPGTYLQDIARLLDRCGRRTCGRSAARRSAASSRCCYAATQPQMPAARDPERHRPRGRPRRPRSASRPTSDATPRDQLGRGGSQIVRATYELALPDLTDEHWARVRAPQLHGGRRRAAARRRSGRRRGRSRRAGWRPRRTCGRSSPRCGRSRRWCSGARRPTSCRAPPSSACAREKPDLVRVDVPNRGHAAAARRARSAVARSTRSSRSCPDPMADDRPARGGVTPCAAVMAACADSHAGTPGARRLAATSLALLAPLGWPFELFAHFRRATRGGRRCCCCWPRAASARAVRPGSPCARSCCWTCAAARAAQPSADAPPASCDGPAFTVATVNLQFDNAAPRAIPRVAAGHPADDRPAAGSHGAWADAIARAATPYPYASVATREDPYGIGVLSRWPIAEVRHCARSTLAGDGVPSAGRRPAHALAGAAGAKSRDRVLDAAAAEVAGPGSDSVLLGDLNLTPYAPAFTRLLEHPACATSSATGAGARPGRPASGPSRCAIDHVLVPRSSCVIRAEIGPSIGSDHRPVLVDAAPALSGSELLSKPNPAATAARRSGWNAGSRMRISVARRGPARRS